MLLYFDGVALVIPRYMRDRLEERSPELVLPLLDAHLLHVVEPEEVVDKAVTEELAQAMTEIITSGALDSLAGEDTAFHELSYSRLGLYGDAKLARMIYEELKKKKLAADTTDGLSVPLHPMVHRLVLILLSQILKSRGESLQLNLEPTTDQQIVVDALCEFLSLSSAPSVSNVVRTDLEIVDVDLSLVPLDEVLSFRLENKMTYRQYRHALKDFVRIANHLPPDERAATLDKRKQEIEEIGRSIEARSRKMWKKPTSCGLAIAGVAWDVYSGDIISTVLSLGSTLFSGRKSEVVEGCAYSYLFRASQLGQR